MSYTPGPWEPSDPPAAEKPKRVPPRRLVVALGVAGVCGLGIWGLSRLIPGQITTMNSWSGVLQLTGCLALAAAGLASMRQFKVRDGLRAAAAWVAIAGVLVLGFTYKDELGAVALRMRLALAPAYPVRTAPRELSLSADAGGAWRVMGAVNGTPVTFTIDTGASDIVLSPHDARRLGIAPGSLRYTHVYETANGVGEGAPYSATSLTVGPIQLSNVAMSVNKAPMSTSLLGMSFLRKLKGFEMQGNQLTLRW